MIRLPLHSLKSGMKVAKPIYGINGNLLVGRDLILSENFIQKLNDMDISSLFIQDGHTDDIIPFENVSDVLRESTIKNLKDLFQFIKEILEKELKDKSDNAIEDFISSEKFKFAIMKNDVFEQIKNNLNEVILQLINREMMIGIDPIKTKSNHKYEHYFDVAVVSIMIGLKMGLREKALRELGFGCFLHDIGEMFIPQEIINKPSKLTTDEMNQIQTHPMTGYKLIKNIPGVSVMSAMVALQHHEKQDGTGYPRGLHGRKMVGVTNEPNAVHVFGGITAVAEIYDALISDRPYRKALPREKVIDFISKMENGNLNSEILRKFLDITPFYPDGTVIRISSNKYYVDYFGVVTEINYNKPGRPKIRLLYNQNRESIDPIDVNLVNIDADDINIISVK